MNLSRVGPFYPAVAIAFLLIVSLGLAGSLALSFATSAERKRKARRMAELAAARIASLEHEVYAATRRAEGVERRIHTTETRATAAEERLARLATYEEILERRASERRSLKIAA